MRMRIIKRADGTEEIDLTEELEENQPVNTEHVHERDLPIHDGTDTSNDETSLDNPEDPLPLPPISDTSEREQQQEAPTPERSAEASSPAAASEAVEYGDEWNGDDAQETYPDEDPSDLGAIEETSPRLEPTNKKRKVIAAPKMPLATRKPFPATSGGGVSGSSSSRSDSGGNGDGNRRARFVEDRQIDEAAKRYYQDATCTLFNGVGEESQVQSEAPTEAHADTQAEKATPELTVALPSSFEHWLKDHQKEAVKFIMEQLFRKMSLSQRSCRVEEDLSGCILAHCMGMFVCTTLISTSTSSPNSHGLYT
jgi:hypothetical protein